MSSSSVFDLFCVGIGPSSSHTVGPMRAAASFARLLRRDERLPRCERITVDLFGSLGATGRGHRTDVGVVLGLAGRRPDSIRSDEIDTLFGEVADSRELRVLGEQPMGFDVARDIRYLARERLPLHPNGIRFTAFVDGKRLEHVYYSIGGGSVLDPEADDETVADAVPLPYTSAAQLLGHCDASERPIWAIVLENERARMPEAVVRSKILGIWQVMQECVENGCSASGLLPGALEVPRRAAALAERLRSTAGDDGLAVMDWVNLYALAVNEENAAGHRVVTAPTNGAAGIVPAVLHYYRDFVAGANDDGVIRLLLTAGAIGIVIKRNASISGAEVGCQGEVGSACAMAAAGLAEVLGGTPRQVQNAAEIALEHNLGLTCDPVGGLVQIPCIERNAVASVQAVNAARMALWGDGTHAVSLDEVIATMYETGRDMLSKYKETSRGGLAVNVVEC